MRAAILLALLASGTWPCCLRGNEPPVRRAPEKSAREQSPLRTDPDAARAGKKLFSRHCVSCHGAEAWGTASAPSLRGPQMRGVPEGALFWVLRNGSLRNGMPPFSHLPPQQRWQIVSYLKSLDKD